MVEADLRDILGGRYRSGAHPNAVLGTLLSIVVDFGIPVFFCSDQAGCLPSFVEGFLHRYHRKVSRRCEQDQTTNPVTVRGRVETVFYAGPRFSAGRLVTVDGDEVQFAGRLFARENEPVVLNGRWVTHPKYGRQFEVEGMEYDLDLDADGLAQLPWPTTRR